MTPVLDRESSMAALLAALPYIRLFRGSIFVIKAGGAMCADRAALAALAAQLAVLRELGIQVVLVHGGGPQTTTLSRRLGLETTLVEGRRVTSEETLAAAVMTLNGSVRTAILAACRAAALPAVGLSGVDAGLVRAVRRPPQRRLVGGREETVDFGLVGDILAVDPTAVRVLLAAGIVPVLSPLCADDQGQVLNVNADTVAATLARELGAKKLVFLTDAPGLLHDAKDRGSLVSYTDVHGLSELTERGAIETGMLPKVAAAREALLGGVERVHMVTSKGRVTLLVEIFTNEGAGTLIVRDAAELLPAEQHQLAAAVTPTTPATAATATATAAARSAAR